MVRKSNPVVKAATKALPPDLVKEVVKSFDIVGDIAVIKIPPTLLDFRFKLAEALLKELHHIKVVLRQTSPHEGDYRIRGVEWLAGGKRTTTLHREHGCTFFVDLSKAFFTPRLSYERARVANLVKNGENIFNMFAGVGCFSIIIAKRRSCKVYSVDINPYAAKYMLYNVNLNKVQGEVDVILADSKFLACSSFRKRMDRVLMPLPLKAYEYIDAAVDSLREEGFIYYYDVEKGKDSVRKVEAKVLHKLEALKVEVLHSRIVRKVGPKTFQVVLDLKIEKLM